jgi:two-component system alkaline phosphatase synthesis response regulator PhoP
VSQPRSRTSFIDRAAAAGVALGRPLRHGSLAVDLDRYEAWLDGDRLDLTARQLELLALLAADPGRVWSREQLHVVCWADGAPSRRVDVQLCRIRAQVGASRLRTVPQRGWSLRLLPE